jgi:hypothetical protein
VRDGTRATLPEYKDDEYADAIREAIKTFEGQKKREWLVWGSGLMVRLQREVDEEAEAKRVIDEAEREAKKEAEAKRAIDEAEREAEETKKRLADGWMDEAQAGELQWDEVIRRIKALEEGKDWEMRDGEVGKEKDAESLVGGGDVVEIAAPKVARKARVGRKDSTFGPGRMKMVVEIPAASRNEKKRGVDEGKPEKVRDPIVLLFFKS